MEKLTFEEIEKIITSELFVENDMGPQRFLDDNTELTEYEKKISTPEFLDALKTLGDFECVDSYGGEGFGEVYWAVYYFKDHDIYVKFDGWYQSYGGSEFESMFQVAPEEVTVIKYKRVNA